MSQVNANYEEMFRFVSELRAFNTQLHESMSRLQGQFTRLSETWRDTEQQRFAQQFQQTTNVLQQFLRSSNDEYIPYLTKKATALRDAHNIR